MIVKYPADVRVFLPGDVYDDLGLREVTLRVVKRDVVFEGEFEFSDAERIKLISAQSRFNRMVEKANRPL